jgi:hypothetical protein
VGIGWGKRYQISRIGDQETAGRPVIGLVGISEGEILRASTSDALRMKHWCLRTASEGRSYIGKELHILVVGEVIAVELVAFFLQAIQW